MAEGFVSMLPQLIGTVTQLATTFIGGGNKGGYGMPGMGTPPFVAPGAKSPFSGMNPALIQQIIAQNNNNEGLAGLGGFTEGSGVPMSDTEQQIPQ